MTWRQHLKKFLIYVGLLCACGIALSLLGAPKELGIALLPVAAIAGYHWMLFGFKFLGGRTLRQKLTIGSSIFFFVLLIAIISTFASDLLNLPATSKLEPGAKLSLVMPNLSLSGTARISKNPPSALMSCMSCKESSENGECRKQKASYVARSLLLPGSGMLSWHFRVASLSVALRAKYDDEALNKIYFALVSRIARKENIDQVCEARVAKPYSEMKLDELNSMFNFLKYGSERGSENEFASAAMICSKFDN